MASDFCTHHSAMTEAGQLTQTWHPTASFENGRLCVDFIQAPPAEMKSILLKIAASFNLAYKRFLDLQKAEAQAREAQIEAALERVRAASMAMHKTDELAQVVKVLFQQFSQLELDFYQVWINIFLLEEGYSNCWFSPVKGVIKDGRIIIDRGLKRWNANSRS